MRIAFVTLAVLFSAQAWADITVIENPDLDLAADDVSAIYTAEKQGQGSEKLHLSDNKSLQKAFVQKALGMDVAKYRRIWVKKTFRWAAEPPTTKSNDSEINEYVRETPGAVGYVRTVGQGVKVLTVLKD